MATTSSHLPQNSLALPQLGDLTANDNMNGESNDDAAINKILNDGSVDPSIVDLWSRDVDQRGKSENAKDFEDISDDDLPDEELPQQESTDQEIAKQLEDDLFGESGFGDGDGKDDTATETQNQIFDYAEALQANGLAQFIGDGYLPVPPQNDEEVFKAMWPDFRQDEAPRFQQLFPSKPAQYVGKLPLKPPKPLNLTKVILEVSQDQSKTFRTSGAATSSRNEVQLECEQNGLVPILSDGEDSDDNKSEVLEEDYVDPDEKIGAVSWADVEVACVDWDVKTFEDRYDEHQAEKSAAPLDPDDDLFEDDWDLDDQHPAKRQRVSDIGDELYSQQPFNLRVLDNADAVTARNAQRVVLDLNDTHLLLQVEDPKNKVNPSSQGNSLEREASTAAMSARYYAGADDAYEHLKENHQNKVRGTLSTLSVEHSLPAVKLQYPFYKAELDTREARSFHRPTLAFHPNQHIYFERSRKRKRKANKIKDIKSVFTIAADLTLNDNADVALFEYSEEYPISLSNFGMGNRVVNYYRKTTPEDSTRPKMDIGEPTILFPQDRSPFAMFGFVEPGEVVPTLHNSMYRAPIFEQKPKGTDFLVIRGETGVDGKSYGIRNLDHLYTVGQEFPLMDVPGPHARKVTTAQKNRMKMIAFRLANKDRNQTVDMPDVTKHIRDSTDLQNRQKMKEFMKYNKEFKRWGMKPEEILPDELAIRSMVKPEDVCLIESMQVGKRHLQDTGYGKDVDAELEDEEAKEGESLEKQMAPWSLTRNFLLATQGKAMLQLHGEGDPSGRGEAFSLLKTSMKGGFKALGESVADRIEAQKQEADSGHKYNVAKQAKAYEETIKRIWQAQKSSLSTQVENSDVDMDDFDDDDPDESMDLGRNPRSESHPNLESEIGSQMSKGTRGSMGSQHGNKVLRIKGRKRHPNGQYEEIDEVIRNPTVIKMYIKKRTALEMESTDVREIKPTGDAEKDKRAQKRIMDELARLERNKDRRIARDKQKGIITDENAGSPSSPASPSGPSNAKAAGTSRKCANCGMVGHIKTNKKLCPKLNGTQDPGGSGFATTGFGSLAAATNQALGPPPSASP